MFCLTLDNHFSKPARHNIVPTTQSSITLAMGFNETSFGKDKMHVLIAGGGIVGLTIAQGCRENNIPYTVFESETEGTRRHGWCLTLHWCLNALERTIGPEAAAKLPDAVVDKSLKSDAGNFLFLNCETAGVRFKIPPSKNRLRLHRKKLRDILVDGVNIQEGKKLVSVEEIDGGVRAHFEDGTFADGTLLIGADGIHSSVRAHVLPDDYALTPLSINLIGVIRHLTPEQAAPVRALDPLLFQGLHPKTGNFLWYSTHDSFQEPDGRYSYDAQVIVSWVVKDPISDAIPETNNSRVEMMKRRASNFAEPLRSIVVDIPTDVDTTAIKLADFPCREWDNRGGRVTLAGDSAHAMTMYRGEGANHGILDAALLVDQLKRMHTGEIDQKTAIDSYEAEMVPRAFDAVMKSRRAAFAAHDWDAITEDSPIVGARLPPTTTQVV
ncbi:FAD/NAD(P)-binding domain-containing protein [Jackrogersella minutella]|nr:FAD/NAD(P)-binding domain-containing protein [Jackrogersella minutella]